MIEGSSEKFLITEAAHAVLSAHDILINADGTLTYKGTVVTPKAINQHLQLEDLLTLHVDAVPDKEHTIMLVYHVPPVAHPFEVCIAKNNTGENTLHFYIPELTFN